MTNFRLSLIAFVGDVTHMNHASNARRSDDDRGSHGSVGMDRGSSDARPVWEQERHQHWVSTIM